MNEKNSGDQTIKVSQKFLKWLMERILSDMSKGVLPPEIAKYLVKMDFSDSIRAIYTWQEHSEEFKKLLHLKITEYKSFAIFAARNLGSEEFNKGIFDIFSDESEKVDVRVAAMYHLVASSYGNSEERKRYLLFCENNRETVEAEARRYYGKTGVTSDDEMLNQIIERINNKNYSANRFLYLFNLSFIKNEPIKKKAINIAMKFVEDEDNLVRETALKIVSNAK